VACTPFRARDVRAPSHRAQAPRSAASNSTTASSIEPLDLALELTDNIQAAYLNADPTERRLLNQAFFERIEIDTETATDGQLSGPSCPDLPTRGRHSR
jgi:hypothetical protein